MLNVIYHADCTDGFAAAWAVRRYFMLKGQEPWTFAAHYPPAGQDTALPQLGRDDEVIIVDFSLSREQMVRLKESVLSLIVLDHHKTAQEACAGLDFCIFDMERSGAALAWDHYFAGFTNNEAEAQARRPWLINYVQDRDLWQWKLPDSRAVNAYLQCLPKTWDDFDRVAELEVEQVIRLGAGAEMHTRWYVREMVKQARRLPFPKHLGAVEARQRRLLSEEPPDPTIEDDHFRDVPVVNSPYFMASETVGQLAAEPNVAFAVGWYQQGNGMYKYDLRSRGEFDVSLLARRFGGGGHKNAAGFVVDRRVC